MKTRYSEKGVALILTLSVLAIMLVLVVSYATLSRTETQSASNYQDYIASRYAAEAAMNRALADFTRRYANDPNLNLGSLGIYSKVSDKTNSFSSITSSGNTTQKESATDIEKVVTDQRGFPSTQKGSDNKIDYVALPGQTTDTTPQWIGLRDKNHNLVSRMAYVLTSGLNINAIGSEVPNVVGGPNFNSRNQGYSVGELNLPAAIMASGSTGTWNYESAVNAARRILDYRYSPAGFPGGNDRIDTRFNGDAIDENGDGLPNSDNPFTDTGDDGSGTGGVPELYLRANATNRRSDSNRTIKPHSGNRMINDLKQLCIGGIIGDAITKSKFSANFASIQRWFTTQSSILTGGAGGPLNLNDPIYDTDPNRFFNDLYNTLQGVQNASSTPLFTQTQSAQIAANIVTYAGIPTTANPNGSPEIPYIGNVPGGPQNVVGVGRVPFIDQVVIKIIVAVTTAAGPPATVSVSINCQPQIKLWYPYTQIFQGSAGLNIAITGLVNATVTSPAVPGSFTWRDPPGGLTTFNGTEFNVDIPFDQTITTGRFHAVAINDLTIPGSIGYSIDTPGMASPLGSFTPGNITIAIPTIPNGFAVTLTDATGNIIDQTLTSDFDQFDPSASPALVFSQALLQSVAVAPPLGGAPITQNLIGYISFALNDPRFKNWKVEYISPVVGLAAPPPASLNDTNYPVFITATNLPAGPTGYAIYRPDLGEDRRYRGPGMPTAGIGRKTFDVRGSRLFSSVGELGRIHRGQDWGTIDLTEGGSDAAILDNFSIEDNTRGIYQYGQVNLRTQQNDTPIWAALFAGMPVQTEARRDRGQTNPVFIDYPSSTTIDPNFTQSKALGNRIGGNGRLFTNANLSTLITNNNQFGILSDLSGQNPSAFPAGNFLMQTDEDREWMISHMVNLVNVQKQGLFTVTAWGQSLRGPPPMPSDKKHPEKSQNRFVTAETQITALVSFEVDPTTNRLRLNIISYRYNPDFQIQ